jgi:micrococcal nuclease
MRCPYKRAEGRLKTAAAGAFVLFLSVVLSAGSGGTAVLSPLVEPSDSGLVVAVYDGDSLKVRLADGSEQRVRLIGVDTPELTDSREEVALWAHLARRFSFYYLYGKKVRLGYDQTRLDKYGRTLAYVWTEAEKLYNEFIIRRGFGYAYFAFPFRSDYQKLFREAQLEARREKRGFWQESEPGVRPAAEARSYLGEYVAVRFVCSHAAKERSFVYLAASGREFEALIPTNRQAFFPAAETYLGKALIVSGLLEEFHGRLQIVAFFPRQLRPDAGRQ